MPRLLWNCFLSLVTSETLRIQASRRDDNLLARRLPIVLYHKDIQILCSRYILLECGNQRKFVFFKRVKILMCNESVCINPQLVWGQRRTKWNRVMMASSWVRIHFKKPLLLPPNLIFHDFNRNFVLCLLYHVVIIWLWACLL